MLQASCTNSAEKSRDKFTIYQTKPAWLHQLQYSHDKSTKLSVSFCDNVKKNWKNIWTKFGQCSFNFSIQPIGTDFPLRYIITLIQNYSRNGSKLLFNCTDCWLLYTACGLFSTAAPHEMTDSHYLTFISYICHHQLLFSFRCYFLLPVIEIASTHTHTHTHTHTRPCLETYRPVVALCPNTPLKKAGIRMLPPMSEPIPITDAAVDWRQPSPPVSNIILVILLIYDIRRSSCLLQIAKHSTRVLEMDAEVSYNFLSDTQCWLYNTSNCIFMTIVSHHSINYHYHLCYTLYSRNCQSLNHVVLLLVPKVTISLTAIIADWWTC